MSLAPLPDSYPQSAQTNIYSPTETPPGGVLLPFPGIDLANHLNGEHPLPDQSPDFWERLVRDEIINEQALLAGIVGDSSLLQALSANRRIVQQAGANQYGATNLALIEPESGRLNYIVPTRDQTNVAMLRRIYVHAGANPNIWKPKRLTGSDGSVETVRRVPSPYGIEFVEVSTRRPTSRYRTESFTDEAGEQETWTDRSFKVVVGSTAVMANLYHDGIEER